MILVYIFLMTTDVQLFMCLVLILKGPGRHEASELVWAEAFDVLVSFSTLWPWERGTFSDLL